MQPSLQEQKRSVDPIRFVDRDIRVRLFLVCVIILLTGLYLYGTVLQALYVNHGGTDQGSYVNFTQALYHDPSYINGNQMPLFPFIVRLFYQPGMSEETLFELGKLVGIGVSLISLTAISIIFYHYFRGLLAASLILITAFTLYIFKAPYYQAELLFFTLFFVAFVLMCQAFGQLTLRRAFLIGLLLGLAMLAKASAVVPLVLFAGLKVVQIGVTWFTSRFSVRRESVLKSLAGVALVVIVFLLVLSGYMASSRRIFGPLFYNVNTTFYMWYDSWDEVLRGTRAHGDRVGWPDMPAEELPSLSKYWADHGPRYMLRRVTQGLEVTYEKHCTYNYNYAFGYCKYVAAFGVAAIVFVALNLSVILQALRRNLFLVLFCASYLLTHFILSGWWVPISPGRRFLLAMYLPLMFILASIFTISGTRSLYFCVLGMRTNGMTLFLSGVLL